MHQIAAAKLAAISEAQRAELLRAFASCDARRGWNFVSLVALRQACPLARGPFDAALDGLRRENVLTMSAAEGRHGISAEERAAGILEDGCLLLYVSRKESA